MACSAILVLDLKGRVLLARDYRGDIPLKQADRFIQKVKFAIRSTSSARRWLACKGS
jgi:hypothetical protein